MAEKKEVIFRRIRGRIVPIRVRRDQVKESAILSGGAISLGVTGGLLSRKATLDAKRDIFKSRSASFTARLSPRNKRAASSARKFRIRATARLKLAKGLRLGAIALTTIGLTEATQELFQGSSEQESKIRDFTIGTTGAVASTAFALGFTKFSKLNKLIKRFRK